MTAAPSAPAAHPAPAPAAEPAPVVTVNRPALRPTIRPKRSFLSDLLSPSASGDASTK
jgi:hypothetical protein